MLKFMRFKTIYRLSLVGILFVSLFSASSVSAQTGANVLEEITISPTSKDYRLDPGQTVRDSFKVVNTGQKTFKFNVYSRPYSLADTGQAEFDEVKDRSDAYAWVQFENTSWEIKPSETIEVNYEILVPENATPGGHYGVMFAEVEPDNSSNEAVIAKKRVGSILRATVKGDIKQAGRPLNIDLPWLQFQPPLRATTEIENSGNVDSQATIKMTAHDVFGNVKHEQSKQVVVYPDFDSLAGSAVSRSATVEWGEAAWFSIYKVDMSVSFQDETIDKSSYVLILPRWMIVIGVVALIGGGYVLFRRRK